MAQVIAWRWFGNGYTLPLLARLHAAFRDPGATSSSSSSSSCSVVQAAVAMELEDEADDASGGASDHIPAAARSFLLRHAGPITAAMVSL